MAGNIISRCEIAQEISSKLRGMACTSDDMAKLSSSVINMLSKLERDPESEMELKEVNKMLSEQDRKEMVSGHEFKVHYEDMVKRVKNHLKTDTLCQ